MKRGMKWARKIKKIEIQVADAKVNVGKDSFEGYTLTIGKKVIGEIAELDGQFAIIKNGNVDSFYKKTWKSCGNFDWKLII